MNHPKLAGQSAEDVRDTKKVFSWMLLIVVRMCLAISFICMGLYPCPRCMAQGANDENCWRPVNNPALHQLILLKSKDGSQVPIISEQD